MEVELWTASLLRLAGLRTGWGNRPCSCQVQLGLYADEAPSREATWLSQWPCRKALHLLRQLDILETATPTALCGKSEAAAAPLGEVNLLLMFGGSRA